MFEKTKRFCNSLVEMGLPGFDVAVYHKGKCVLRYANGYNDLENKTKMKGNERYNIYSCSKVITCVAALQLWEKGLYTLEDKLSDYMPEFTEMTVKTEDGIKKAEKPILIKHLFEMTAGFSYDCETPYLLKGIEETDGKAPTRKMMEYLAKEPLLFEPGERWEYSLCHDVLAALVEVISGEKFEDYVKKNIFDVAGMPRSTFLLPDEELDTLCEQYHHVDNVTKNIGKGIHYLKIGEEYVAGGAGCISTVDDYIAFLEALRTGKLLKPETVQLMQTDRLTAEQKVNYWYSYTHGYGLGVRTPGANDNYTDFGWGGAACAFLAIDIEKEISIYFGAHMVAAPVHSLSGMLYRFVYADLIDPSRIPGLRDELKTRFDYILE